MIHFLNIILKKKMGGGGVGGEKGSCPLHKRIK